MSDGPYFLPDLGYPLACYIVRVSRHAKWHALNKRNSTVASCGARVKGASLRALSTEVPVNTLCGRCFKVGQ